MKLKVNEKEYQIKFSTKATIKSGILGKLVELEGVIGNENNANVSDLLLTLVPTLSEMILVGLQKYHFDEFGFDYDTNDGKNEKLDLIYDMLDEMSDDETFNAIELFTSIQSELLDNGFLARMFQMEQKKPSKKTAK